jgi:cellulose synthase/poly-beta-1,6-N-acetylglucosamine synthase-like glycosyltransferase
MMMLAVTAIAIDPPGRRADAAPIVLPGTPARATLRRESWHARRLPVWLSLVVPLLFPIAAAWQWLKELRMPETAQLSVIMPVYNEEGRLLPPWTKCGRHVLTLLSDSELVIVDDGSRDATGRLLDEAAASDPRIRVIHQPNGGHGAALLTGLNAARGDTCF